MSGKTLKELVRDIEFTVTDNDTTTPNIAIQLVDIAGNDCDEAVKLEIYLSTDADGDTLAVDGTDTTEIAVGTNGVILYEPSTDIIIVAKTDTDGQLDLEVTVVDTKSVYVNVVHPTTGEIVTCPTALYYTS